MYPKLPIYVTFLRPNIPISTCFLTSSSPPKSGAIHNHTEQPDTYCSRNYWCKGLCQFVLLNAIKNYNYLDKHIRHTRKIAGSQGRHYSRLTVQQ
jgi:hypothetical protein